MFNITLLSSFHLILGKCNPDELYKIIEEIQPEIIFEELSFDSLYLVYSAGYQPQTVEAITIKYYLQKHSIKHFPIDNYPTKETDLLSNAQIIYDSSYEYGELWDKKLLKPRQDGYKFLNSNECTEILNRMRIIEETVLAQTKNAKLLNEYKTENALHDKRVSEMLRAIYNYSKQHSFDKALFICGAEHREPLRQKIKEYGENESIKLRWTFYNDN